MTLRIVCAWCQRVLWHGDPGAPTSHTACETCAARLLEDFKKGRTS